MRKIKFKVVNKNDGSCVVHSNSSFYLKYLKGKNTYAKKDSLGVMVFHTRESAEDFIYMHSPGNCDYVRNSQDWKIKRVIPLGRGNTPKYISRYVVTKDFKELIKLMKLNTSNDEIWNTMIYSVCSPIEDTICYPGVHVID